jgi:hypothetical protein
MTRKVNYLNNKDILKQIHLSKTSYCTYINREKDYMFDLIIEDVSEINVRTLKQAREARATRLSKETGEIVDLKTITNTDVVFRVMTDEHVPRIQKKPKKKIKPKKVKDVFKDEFSNIQEEVEISEDPNVIMIPTKCNFPPFFHYRVNGKKQPFIVGKSHWKGDFDTGEFNKDLGEISAELAKMFMKLCERYGTRSNWRGYTYNDEMRGQALVQLVQVGLQFNEMKSQNPFAYYTAVITNCFTRILITEKKMQNIRDDILEQHGLDPSWTRQLANEAEIEKTRKNRFKQLNIP